MEFNSGFKGLIIIRWATCFDLAGSLLGLHYDIIYDMIYLLTAIG